MCEHNVIERLRDWGRNQRMFEVDKIPPDELLSALFDYMKREGDIATAREGEIMAEIFKLRRAVLSYQVRDDA